MQSCLQLLPGGRDAHPNGRRSQSQAGRYQRRRRDLRDRAGRILPTVWPNSSARQVVEHQAGVQGNAGGWNRACYERGAPLSYEPRMEACDRRRMRALTTTAPHTQQQARGPRRLRRRADGRRRLPPGLSLRDGSRRRTARFISLQTTGPRPADGLSLSPAPGRSRGARTRERLLGGAWR